MKLTSDVEGRQYLVKIFTDYLLEKHLDEIKDINNTAIKGSDFGYVVNVDAMILVQDHAWLSWYLLNDAIRLLDLFNEALKRVTCEIRGQNCGVKYNPRCIVRLSSVPICDETSRTRMPRCSDVGHLLSISATVLNTAPLQVFQYQRQYQCLKCLHIFLCMVSESDATYTIIPPRVCPSCGAKAPKAVSINDGSDCRNRQQLRIQEQTRYLAVGMMPRSIVVILDDDLVDCAQPGDDVIVIGTVIRRWKKYRPNDMCDAELVVLANNIQVTNHSFIESQSLNCEAKVEFKTFWKEYGTKCFNARNAIISQMCPLIYGMYYLKLALALVLSGSPSCNFNGLKVRGESHMLLIGDPGTAKSQFLKFASKIVPRSVFTTGIGSTSAGLTVTAVKDSGDWSLEAGALVLADGGVCCIDEFGSIREHDKTAIHEAMEQQTISVAKAGIVCKLRTRCSIIAATNPKGCYDVDRSISCNTAIASPLLSRFDLIFLLLDNCNETWDRRVSNFILNHQTTDDTKDGFNIDKLKSYFLFIKSNFHPKMTQEASNVLEKYYSWMRKLESSQSLDRITMRFLESLIRLSQSHARLMMRNEVLLEDAIVAVAVMESTVYGSTILSANEQLPSEFPVDADQEYKLLEEIIVRKLQVNVPRKVPADFSSNRSEFVAPDIVTARPIIKRKYCQTQPIQTKTQNNTLCSDRKSMNKSVLDNFHIATQISEQPLRNCERLNVTLESALFNDEEDNENVSISEVTKNMCKNALFNEEEDSDNVNISEVTKNMFKSALFKEEEDGDNVNISEVTRNMFNDSMSNHPELTDADFDI